MKSGPCRPCGPRNVRIKHVLIGSTRIIDTFAEAFRLRFARLVVTAHDGHWLDAAIRAACGYGTSVIGCDAETGLERLLGADETPDGRPGAALLAFCFSAAGVAAAAANRAAQCLLTCPTVSVFDGLPAAEERCPLGGHIRFFGDGFEKSKVVDGRRYWRVPVMDGEFLAEETVGVDKGVGGGNFILQGRSLEGTLAAARRAVTAIGPIHGIITPFPGGVVRSGSKVGSRYETLRASTNEAFCPSLVGRVETHLVEGAVCSLEIVIDGVDEQAVAAGMAAGIRAAAGPEIAAISAGNYGGKLGKFHLHLHQVLSSA
ncbi:MAG: formylmethanofuran--tetrahydromethanopterin N-formyltransferase [Planctomycetia bacterium]|nr:formylmethanofuran--tetrahydromethanopterin N-formyltransferase [Planctomycetia bacterium]